MVSSMLGVSVTACLVRDKLDSGAAVVAKQLAVSSVEQFSLASERQANKRYVMPFGSVVVFTTLIRHARQSS